MPQECVGNANEASQQWRQSNLEQMADNKQEIQKSLTFYCKPKIDVVIM